VHKVGVVVHSSGHEQTAACKFGINAIEVRHGIVNVLEELGGLA
jgi:hypothetical protein